MIMVVTLRYDIDDQADAQEVISDLEQRLTAPHLAHGELMAITLDGELVDDDLDPWDG